MINYLAMAYKDSSLVPKPSKILEGLGTRLQSLGLYHLVDYTI